MNKIFGIYLVAYDIRSNKIRQKAVKALGQAGLYRIQKSVFLGATLPEQIYRLQQQFEQWIEASDNESDHYMIIPLSDRTLDRSKWIGRTQVDWDFILGRKPVHFV